MCCDDCLTAEKRKREGSQNDCINIHECRHEYEASYLHVYIKYAKLSGKFDLL